MQQTRVEKKGEARSLDRNKARQERYERETLAIATYFGMLVLLGITIIFVVWRAPNFTPGANNPEAWLKMHQGMNYFVKAKALVKPLIQEPVENGHGNGRILIPIVSRLVTESGWPLERSIPG